MKKILFFAATAMLFAACTSEEAEVPVVAGEATNGAVIFDTYTPAATRLGTQDVMTTTKLQTSGFGVFAVQSDNAIYASSQTTNFMWNEKLTYSSSAWSYEPVKYWPNETDNDSQEANAESDHIDRLSFFAYAPYVPELADTYTGKLDGVTYGTDPNATAHGASTEKGIVALSPNNDATNDPYVWYVASDVPSQSVDLLWGVAPSGGLSYPSVASALDNNAGVAQIASGTVTVADGMPLVDLIKPSKDQKIKFLFKHALARLGVTVVAAVDQMAPGGELKTGTKIAVESIKITTAGTNKLFTEGRLNLKNTSAGVSLWPEKSVPVTDLIIDETHELSNEIRWKTNITTTLALPGFHGVDQTERNAIRKANLVANDPAYFMLIPSHADTDIKVTITYYVFTEDAKVPTGYTLTKNVIDKTVTINGLTNNKAYNLKLILGMASVKLDAEVADWQVDGSTDVNLPRNNE